MKKILLALQFLTIVPVKDMGEVPERDMGRTTMIFPIIGFAEGIVLVLLSLLLLRVFPAEVTNALLVLVLTVMNGGLHLDGLADTFDAIASRGDREKKLRIMKDSSIGPTGVIAIVMVLLLKYALLNALFFQSTVTVYFSMLSLMPVVSRWTMVPAAYNCTAARQDGLGRVFLEHTGTRELLTATGLAAALALLIFSVFSQYALFVFYGMVIMPIHYALSFGTAWFCTRYFGGMTGDSFGAVHEIAVLVFLMTTVTWSQKFI